MGDNQREENRQNVRAAISVPVHIKCLYPEENKSSSGLQSGGLPVAPEDSKSKSSGFIDTSVANLADFLIKIEEKTDPSIAYFSDSLIQIDEKLDLIIDILKGDKRGGVLNVKETVDLSGAGLSVIAGDPVDKGTLVDITLRIPGFPLGKFKSLGKIIRVDPQKGKNKGLFNLGIEFLNVSEQEKEGLIAYIFCQQRRMIRQGNKEKDL